MLSSKRKQKHPHTWIFSTNRGILVYLLDWFTVTSLLPLYCYKCFLQWGLPTRLAYWALTEPVKDNSNESPFNLALQYVCEPFGHFQGLFSHWLQFKHLSFETFTDVTGVFFNILDNTIPNHYKPWLVKKYVFFVISKSLHLSIV